MLQRENHRVRSLKICLKQQRDAYVRQIAKRSGEEAAGDEEEFKAAVCQICS